MKKWLDLSQFTKKSDSKEKKWLDVSQFSKKDDGKDKKWLDNSQFTKKDGEKEKKWLDMSQFTKKKDSKEKRWLDVSQFSKKNTDLGELEKRWLDIAQFAKKQPEKKWLDVSQFSKKWLDNSQFSKKFDHVHLKDKKWIDSSNFAKKWIDNGDLLSEDKRTLYSEEENVSSSHLINACVLQNCVGMTTLENLIKCGVECQKRYQGNHHRPQGVMQEESGSDEVGSKVNKRWVDPLAYGFDRKRSRDVYQRLRQCYWARCYGRLSDAKCINYCASDLAYLLDL